MIQFLTKKILSALFIAMTGIAISAAPVYADNDHFLIDFGSSFFPSNTTGWNV